MTCSIFRARRCAAVAGTLLLLVSSMVRSEAAVDDPAVVEVRQPRACLAACRALGSGFRLGACTYSCAISLLECRGESRDKGARRLDECRQSDDADARSSCRGESSVGFEGCAVTLVPARRGLAPVPQLPTGVPADMSLLDAAERAAIETADQRAAAVRNRELVLRVAGRRRVPVRIVQTHHEFGFGFPIDKRNFDGDPEGLATNETLQPLGKWFELAFAGEDTVSQMYYWAREAKPDATLVFNEWIDEVFTGLDVTKYGLPPDLGTAPTAADVRDRVIELLDQGVPIDVLGQQAHFAPAAAFAPEKLRELLWPGLEFDLDSRTQIDDYAVALDTLAEAGLPIHITETNFIAPQDPELRAAHAEGLMRVWWGHPSVQRIVFCGPWNAVAGRREFDVGLWDDAGELSRHGEAVLSLINDRWRTDVTVKPHWRRSVRLEAVRGDYAAQWSVKGEPVYATFSVSRGHGARRVVLVEPRL